MHRTLFLFAFWMLSLHMTQSATWGQSMGSRTVDGANFDAENYDQRLLTREAVEGFIAIEGRAEVRVRPTEIRVVMAVTSEGQTAKECHLAISESISQLRRSWSAMGIPPERIVEDFIAVLPMYAWDLEKRGDTDVGIEKKTGFRMQTNVHLAVPDEASASRALNAAFEHGVSDIIAFDYWVKNLDQLKIKAREQAVQAARSKSEMLLTAFFDVVPPVINVQEKTTIHYPESLYRSFENATGETVTSGWRRDTPFIRANRPRNTYYRGLYSDGDIQASELPMHPEISVVSSVRVYFESPAASREKEESDED